MATNNAGAAGSSGSNNNNSSSNNNNSNNNNNNNGGAAREGFAFSFAVARPEGRGHPFGLVTFPGRSGEAEPRFDMANMPASVAMAAGRVRPAPAPTPALRPPFRPPGGGKPPRPTTGGLRLPGAQNFENLEPTSRPGDDDDDSIVDGTPEPWEQLSKRQLWEKNKEYLASKKRLESELAGAKALRNAEQNKATKTEQENFKILARLEPLQKQIAAQDAQIKKLQDIGVTATKARDQGHDKVKADLEKHCAILQTLNELQEQRIAELSDNRPTALKEADNRHAKQLIELRDQIASKASENDALRAEGTAHLAQLEQKFTNGEAQYTKAVAENSDLRDKLSSLTSNVNELSDQLNAANTERNNAATQLAQQQAQWQQVQGEFQRLQSENQSQRAPLITAMEQNETLTNGTELPNLQREIHELKDANNNLTEKADTLQKENNNLKTELEAAQEFERAKIELKAQIDHLNLENTKLHNEIANKCSALATENATVVKLCNEISSWSSKYRQLEDALKYAEDECKNLERKLAAQEADLKEHRKDNKDLESSFEASQQALTSLQDDFEKMNNDLQTASAKIEETERAFSEAKLAAEDARNDCDSLSAACAQHIDKEAFDKCAEQLDEMKKEVEELFTQSNKEKTEKEALQSRVEELEEEIASKGARKAGGSLAAELDRDHRGRPLFTGSIENSPELGPESTPVSTINALASIASYRRRRRDERERERQELQESPERLSLGAAMMDEFFNKGKHSSLQTQPEFTMSAIQSVSIAPVSPQTPAALTSSTTNPAQITDESLKASESTATPLQPAEESLKASESTATPPQPAEKSLMASESIATPPQFSEKSTQTDEPPAPTTTSAATQTEQDTAADTTSATQKKSTDAPTTAAASTQTLDESTFVRTMTTLTPYLTFHSIVQSTPAAFLALLLALAIGLWLYAYSADYAAASTFRATWEAANTLTNLDIVGVRAMRDTGVIGIHWGIPSGGYAIVNTFTAFPGLGLGIAGLEWLLSAILGDYALDKAVFTLNMWINGGPDASGTGLLG